MPLVDVFLVMSSSLGWKRLVPRPHRALSKMKQAKIGARLVPESCPNVQKPAKTCISKNGESPLSIGICAVFIGFVKRCALKQLFSAYAQKEQEHLDTVNQILNGQVPNMQQQQGQQQQQNQQQQSMQMKHGGQSNQQDADLCNEMLVIEKYVSGTYDTAVFEFRDTNIRQVLNHIQKEEQQHGEAIFNYMQKKGMYNPS